MSKSPFVFVVSTDDVVIGFGDQDLLVISLRLGTLSSSFSNPVAITVITISSSKLSSITAPNIIFASGSTLLCTNSAAVFTSCSPRLLPPVMLIITPLAPSIEVSSNGLWIA